MLSRSHLLLVAITLLSASVHSFSVTGPLRSALSCKTSYASRPLPTCLFAEEDNEAESCTEETVGEAAPAESPSQEMDILNSPAFLKRKIEVLKSDIEATEKEIEEAKARAEAGKEEWGPQLDNLREEYKNIQERMASQNESRDMESTRAVVREMLEFLDNFDRAFGAIKPETDEEKAIEAEYKDAYQMVLDTIAGLGVEVIPTVGIEFDYEIHQAVMQKPGTEYEEGIVCEEFQKGFKIGDSLIRAAMVAVAA